ncbi:hypothetical protein [Gemmatimonas sp.]|uniref:hypothetical protein n=1 Tax=Gemmatimonas sp. TaxID=1962908 RepID=UPI0037C15E29
MNEALETPWRGRMRLVSADRHLPRRNEPLSEQERDAIEAWLTNGSSIITYTRGRLTREGRPVWVVTTRGVLIATLTDEGFDRVRARAHWVPAEHLRRVDMVTDAELPLVRIVTISRRFVLHGVDVDSAVRFVALAKAAMAASEPPRRGVARTTELR